MLWDIYLDVNVRNVSDNVLVVVQNREGAHTFVVHQQQSFLERLVSTKHSVSQVACERDFQFFQVI